MQKLGCFLGGGVGLGITQGRRKHSHSIEQRRAIRLFTARGYAKRGICRRRVSVCVSVCVCVSGTLQYCIKTAKHRITKRTPDDSPLTLVF